MYIEKPIDRSFAFAVFLSLMIHLFLLGPWYFIFKVNQPKHNKIEATYIRPKVSEKVKNPDTIDVSKSDILTKEKIVKSVSEPFKKAPDLKIQKDISSKYHNPEPKTTSKIKSGGAPEKISNTSKIVSKKEGISGNAALNDKIEQAATQVINLNNINDSSARQSLLKEPGFINYYEVVRSRIKSALEGDFNSFKEEGDVVIHFKIGKNGEVKYLSVVEDKSTQNRFIRKLALGGIEEAAPFPSIPRSFKEEEISFVITISFKLR